MEVPTSKSMDWETCGTNKALGSQSCKLHGRQSYCNMEEALHHISTSNPSLFSVRMEGKKGTPYIWASRRKEDREKTKGQKAVTLLCQLEPIMKVGAW